MTSSPLYLAAFVVLAAGCASGTPRENPQHTPPPPMLGGFTDDYGNDFRLSPELFEQLPSNRFHIVEWVPEEHYFVAQNDSANSSDAGRWTRIDWMTFQDMAPYEWGFCFTAFNASSLESARGATPPDRAEPRTGCNGNPFSRMKPADLTPP